MTPNKEQIQKILYNNVNLNITKDKEEYKILLDLLNNHPNASEKIGIGIDYFYVQPSIYKFNQFNFMLRRIDGSSTDFSFKKCLNPQQKTSKSKDWLGIFREIVKYQIDDFRSCAFKKVGVNNKFICSETNLKFDKKYAHVDHVYPLTFQSIFNEFIDLHKIDLDSIILSEDTGTSEKQIITDSSIVEQFKLFHDKRAVLRIVCNTANLQAKKTRNYNNENPYKLKLELIIRYPQYHLN
jgi:hypothetical protein